MYLFFNCDSLYNLSEFAVPPEKQRLAKEIEDRTKTSYQKDPLYKRLVEGGLSRGEARRAVEIDRKAQRDSLGIPEGKVKRYRQAAARKQRIREEALDLVNPAKQTLFDDARETLKRTRTTRAEIQRQLNILNSKNASYEQKQAALQRIRAFDPKELDEIENAYKAIAQMRRESKPSKTAGNKNRIPQPSQKTAAEKALEAFNRRREEFVPSMPAQVNVPDTYVPPPQPSTTSSPTSQPSSTSPNQSNQVKSATSSTRTNVSSQPAYSTEVPKRGTRNRRETAQGLLQKFNNLPLGTKLAGAAGIAALGTGGYLLARGLSRRRREEEDMYNYYY